MKQVLVTYGARYADRVEPYRKALRDAGVEPVEPGTDAWDGVLLCGGSDIDPAHYGEDPAPELGQTDPPRDVYELDIVWSALQRDVPVLAICRGMQLLNVACGGTLQQHIEGHRNVTHTVAVEAGSRLAAITGESRFPVNSRHHQAVGEVGDGLQVTARAEGIVEALEMPGKRFVVGVQWHPEDRVQTDAPDRALFEAFAASLQ